MDNTILNGDVIAAVCDVTKGLKPLLAYFKNCITRKREDINRYIIATLAQNH
jgi:hypothetical protein